MRYAAIAVSLFVLGLDLHLLRTRPFQPSPFVHHGMGKPWVMPVVSLLIANLLIYLSANEDRQASTRFQLAAAGWIWLLVQLFGALYTLYHP